MKFLLHVIPKKHQSRLAFNTWFPKHADFGVINLSRIINITEKTTWKMVLDLDIWSQHVGGPIHLLKVKMLFTDRKKGNLLPLCRYYWSAFTAQSSHLFTYSQQKGPSQAPVEPQRPWISFPPQPAACQTLTIKNSTKTFQLTYSNPFER